MFLIGTLTRTAMFALLLFVPRAPPPTGGGRGSRGIRAADCHVGSPHHRPHPRRGVRLRSPRAARRPQRTPLPLRQPQAAAPCAPPLPHLRRPRAPRRAGPRRPTASAGSRPSSRGPTTGSPAASATHHLDGPPRGRVPLQNSSPSARAASTHIWTSDLQAAAPPVHLVPAHAAPAMVAPSTPTAATSRLRTSPRRPLRRRRAWLRTSLTSSRSSPSSCTSGGRSLRPAPSWLNRLAGRSTAQLGLRVSGHPACTTTAPLSLGSLELRKSPLRGST